MIVPLLTALDALASKRSHIFPRFGFTFRVSRLLTFTPFIRRIIFQSRGFTSISFDIEIGVTSGFPFLFLLSDTTSRNT
jgi:hypothetical protein